MTGLHQAIFTEMAKDAALLNILGLSDHNDKVEISKRIVPTPPLTLGDETPHLIHFRFPPTDLVHPLMERRSIQFRIWSVDSSLITQQQISRRIQEIFLSRNITVNCDQYSEFFYVGEGDMPGMAFQRFGWFLELSIDTKVQVDQIN